jgi:hypothetical protein
LVAVPAPTAAQKCAALSGSSVLPGRRPPERITAERAFPGHRAVELIEAHAPDYRTLLAFGGDAAIEMECDGQLWNVDVFA